jgi:hypothetical protein
MTLRQPGDGAVLPGRDIALIRQALSACSQLMAWAEHYCGPQFTLAAVQAAENAGLSRAPGALAGRVSLAIDVLDFASPAPQSKP